MSDIKRILVAVREPGARSSAAILKAAQLARAYGAEVELFHTLTEPVYLDEYGVIPSQGLEAVLREFQQRATSQLELAADRLRLHSIKVTVAAEWDYPAYQGIIRRAQSIKADLIVVGRHAGRHRASWLLRLTDWELVRCSPIPVLLVKNSHPWRHPAVLVAVDPGHTFAKPLKLDAQILRLGTSLSEKLKGKLHAVHAYVRVPLRALPPGAMTRDRLVRLQRHSREAARRRFQHELIGSRIASARRYLLGAHPIDAIGEAVRRSHAAIVVLGAVSRSGLPGMVIGNTAERILDELGSDMLVVKPPRFRRRVSALSKGARVAAKPSVPTLY